MFNDLDYIRLTGTPSRMAIVSFIKLLLIGAAIAGWNIP